MTQPFTLAACAEMLWLDKPIEWRVSRLKERGFGVGLWNWPNYDLDALERTGADFTIINGYLRGRLADDEGADELLATARETAEVGRRLGIARLNLHGTGLDDDGIPVAPVETVTGAMWLKARDTLERIADLGAEMGVTFTLENLNLDRHPGCPFNSTSDVLALVSGVDRKELRINLDLHHTQIGEGNLIEWCRRCFPWVGEIQVADVPGRCEPGTGEINFPGIARALDDMGYRGTVAMEAWAAGDSDAALEAFREAFTI